MNGEAMQAVTADLSINNDAFDELDTLCLDELTETQATLFLLARRIELLVQADRLVSDTADRHLFEPLLRQTLAAEKAMHRKLERLERLMAEAAVSTKH